MSEAIFDIDDFPPSAEAGQLEALAEADDLMGEWFITLRDRLGLDPYSPEANVQYVFTVSGLCAFLDAMEDPLMKDELDRIGKDPRANATVIIDSIVAGPAYEAAQEFYLRKNPGAGAEECIGFFRQAGLVGFRNYLGEACYSHLEFVQHEVEVMNSNFAM